VAFGVMPIFAFTNAGVELGWPIAQPRIAAGVFAGLVLGKPLGIVVASWAIVRLGFARLPAGVGWGGVIVVGILAGVGFTVALFIANLGLADAAALASAKVGIVAGSLLAALVALAVGTLVLPRRADTRAATSAEAAEASAET
jgi:NhaA family Na+:H+ antiporter